MATIGGVLKESAKYSVPTALSAVLSLVLIPVISHVYPASEYGVINLFYSLGNLLMLFALFGLDNAFIRFYQEPVEVLQQNQDPQQTNPGSNHPHVISNLHTVHVYAFKF